MTVIIHMTGVGILYHRNFTNNQCFKICWSVFIKDNSAIETSPAPYGLYTHITNGKINNTQRNCLGSKSKATTISTTSHM